MSLRALMSPRVASTGLWLRRAPRACAAPVLTVGLALGGLIGCQSGGLERLGVPQPSYENLPDCRTPNTRTGNSRAGNSRAGNSRAGNSRGQGRGRRSGQRSANQRPRNRRAQARVRPGRVRLSATDLAPVDAYLHAHNTQWILGDTVDIYASKEYFSQALTMNAKIGLVHRRDEKIGGDEVTTLTFIGHESQRSAMNNPRVLIGTGLSVTARRTLRVHMALTRNASIPVQLRVVARGDASRGRRDEVLERGHQLVAGGAIRNVRGRWVWRQLGR